MAKFLQGEDRAGEYIVEIRDPHWEAAGQPGEAKMALVLPGYVELDGEEWSITGRLYFTPALMSAGRNAGKPLYEVNAVLCETLGVPAPFAPNKIGSLDGAKAKFVCNWEDYMGKSSLKVSFINPPGRGAMADADVNDVWAAMTGGRSPAVTVSTAKPTQQTKLRQAQANDDQIPMGDDEAPF